MEGTGSKESADREAALARLSEQADALLALLPEDGSAVGKGRLRQLSGLDEPAYDLAVLALRAQQLARPGRGGSLRRVAPSDGEGAQPSPAAGPGARPQRARTPRSRHQAQTTTDAYVHTEEAVLRPEAGTQAQFKKQKPPKTYAYDSSLSPALDWAGKAERLSFDVPTLPLFVHERLSTRAIIQTLTEHKRDRQLEFQLFADPQLSLAQQLEAYEHTGGWVNRLILGDSLVVMNSLLEYEGLGAQVQMIYIDPPYGVNYRSNFQPFVKSRDVKDGSDDDMTREPETVQAYRDTWELGVHSYLTYLRDRFLLARELLNRTGSIFVQIGNRNVHLVRTILDEVFGSENFVSLISVRKTATPSQLIDDGFFYLVWYARDLSSVKYHQLWQRRRAVDWLADTPGGSWGVELDGERRPLLPGEKSHPDRIPAGAGIYALSKLTSAGAASHPEPFEWNGRTFLPRPGTHWKTTAEGLRRLALANRLESRGGPPWFVRYHKDFPLVPLTNLFEGTAGKSAKSNYVVRTEPDVIARCLLMTTDPGDLVLDPTCGGGTTAYVAEQWGRRWITIDVSRVPLALTRQRLLTATFEHYELRDSGLGPAGGFVYERRQNRKGEESGGIVPHITLESIAQNQPPKQEILVDVPEVQGGITRVSGAFCVEATIPAPLEARDAEPALGDEDAGSFADRLLEVLRRSPVIQLGGGESLTGYVKPIWPHRADLKWPHPGAR